MGKTPERRVKGNRLSPAAGFLLRFAAGAGLFYVFFATPFYAKWVYEPVTRAYAALGAALLQMLGANARASGDLVVSPAFGIHVSAGCDALEPMALFVAGMLAYPLPWRRRLAGIGLGLPILALLNVIRVTSLYAAGVHWPAAFEVLHKDLWQLLFLLCTVGLWVGWVYGAYKRQSSS